MRREFLPAIVVPGLRVERIIITGPNRIIPVPGIKRSLLGMRRGQRLRDAFAALGLLIHRKLVCPDGLIFVHATLDVPAREISAIGARECSRPEAAHRSALPIAVVDHARCGEGRLASAGIIEWLANAALPGRFRDGVAGEQPRRARNQQAKHDAHHQRTREQFHGSLLYQEKRYSTRVRREYKFQIKSAGYYHRGTLALLWFLLCVSLSPYPEN